MLQGCAPYHQCVESICVLLSCCWFVRLRLYACFFRVIVYAFAVVCCNSACHFTVVCRLHVRFVFVTLVYLFVLVFFFM